MARINPSIAVSLKSKLLEGYCKCMCPPGTAFLMPPGWRLHSAWARHRCLQLYLPFVIAGSLMYFVCMLSINVWCVLHLSHPSAHTHTAVSSKQTHTHTHTVNTHTFYFYFCSHLGLILTVIDSDSTPLWTTHTIH